MNLTWYTYFSWWIFIWFIIFKTGFTNLSPYFIYLFVVIFILLKFLRDVVYFLFIDKKKVKNYDLILGWFFLVLSIDIIPFFFLEKQLDKNSIFFTFLLGLVYCLFMEKQKINIIKHYTILNYRELSDRHTLKSFFKDVFLL